MKDSKDIETIDMFHNENNVPGLSVTSYYVTNIFVTSGKSKRGRKPLGDRAMTGAERIAKFRARIKNKL